MSDRVLFVSGRCEHSKKILLGIQQHSFLKSLFKVVNIDTQPYPNYVKSVPSILINNQVITGETVFEYFGYPFLIIFEPHLKLLLSRLLFQELLYKPQQTFLA